MSENQTTNYMNFFCWIAIIGPIGGGGTGVLAVMSVMLHHQYSLEGAFELSWLMGGPLGSIVGFIFSILSAWFIRDVKIHKALLYVMISIPMSVLVGFCFGNVMLTFLAAIEGYWLGIFLLFSRQKGKAIIREN